MDNTHKYKVGDKVLIEGGHAGVVAALFGVDAHGEPVYAVGLCGCTGDVFESEITGKMEG